MSDRPLVALARFLVLAACTLSATGSARAATRSAGSDTVTPVNLELVTLTEDRAVITWYTGAAGTPSGNSFFGIEISGGNHNTVGGATVFVMESMF